VSSTAPTAPAGILIGAARKDWHEGFTLQFPTINGLPGVIVFSPEGPVQTSAFEIEDGLVRALYVMRNPTSCVTSQRLPSRNLPLS